MEQLKKYKWLILSSVYLSIILLFYNKTLHSRFLFDWNSWMVRYIRAGWPGLINCYGDKSMRWGYHLLNMLQWKIFGLQALGWYAFVMFLHVANAVLLVFLVRKLIGITTLQNPFLIAAIAGTLWLLSPYHSETLVWGAAFLFPVFVFQLLAGMIFFLQFTESNQWKYLWLVYLCYFTAMFTFEAFIPFPVVLFVLWLITTGTFINRLPALSFFKLFLLPIFLSLALYFLATKWRVGSWVGHYGEASHLNFDPYLIIPNFTKYLLKLLYIPLYFTLKQRDSVYAFLENKRHVKMAGIAYVVFFMSLAWKFFTGDKKWKLIAGCFALFCAALLPIVNLYFMYMKDIEQDRYVYFASPFFYAAFTIFLFSMLKRWAIIPLLACLTISVIYLQRNTYSWKESGRIANSLLNDFRWQNAERIFVLLTPDDYRGAYCMRSMPNSTLSEMLFVQRNIDIDKKLFEAYQWNVGAVNDSATYTVEDSVTLQVKLISDGGWLWRNSFGANPVETPEFNIQLNEWLPWFKVHFKDRRKTDVFIYAVNDHWKIVSGF